MGKCGRVQLACVCGLCGLSLWFVGVVWGVCVVSVWCVGVVCGWCVVLCGFFNVCRNFLETFLGPTPLVSKNFNTTEKLSEKTKLNLNLIFTQISQIRFVWVCVVGVCVSSWRVVCVCVFGVWWFVCVVCVWWVRLCVVDVCVCRLCVWLACVCLVYVWFVCLVCVSGVWVCEVGVCVSVWRVVCVRGV